MELQARLLTAAPRLHRPHITEDKTPRLMVKATFNIQEHPKKLKHKKIGKEKRDKNRSQKGREQSSQ